MAALVVVAVVKVAISASREMEVVAVGFGFDSICCGGSVGFVIDGGGAGNAGGNKRNGRVAVRQLVVSAGAPLNWWLRERRMHTYCHIRLRHQKDVSFPVSAQNSRMHVVMHARAQMRT